MDNDDHVWPRTGHSFCNVYTLRVIQYGKLCSIYIQQTAQRHLRLLHHPDFQFRYQVHPYRQIQLTLHLAPLLLKLHSCHQPGNSSYGYS